MRQDIIPVKQDKSRGPGLGISQARMPGRSLKGQGYYISPWHLLSTEKMPIMEFSLFEHPSTRHKLPFRAQTSQV